MTNLRLIKFTVLIFVSTIAFGQKVKYKDIYPLLSTKQYDQAEPFLRKYLKANDDNPNAYLFMGMIFQEKALGTDILKQTKLAMLNIDSAIFYYNKTNSLLDDREVRKNKEYYEAYNRRDLRTGEFGVKLSDIQFDLQKRIEGLKERLDKVKQTRSLFSRSDSLYKKSNELFVTIKNQYPSQKELYLRSNEKTVADLKALSVKFDSSVNFFQQYKNISSGLGKTGYNQSMTLVPVDYDKNGTSTANFYDDDLQVWDYKKLADQSRTVIEKEIFPMRENLITYDVEINKLRERLNKDSVSVRNDLTKLVDKLLYDQLKKYDDEPLPMEVFSLKTADLAYRSLLIENKKFKDSADVHLKLKLINQEIKSLTTLDSIARKLADTDIDLKTKNYEHFVANTYGDAVVLKSYINALKEYAANQYLQKTRVLSQRSKALNWILDGTDSIPLRADAKSVKYRPLFTGPEKYTVGLTIKDSLNSEGYFYVVSSSRKAEIKSIFPVEKVSFKQSRHKNAHAVTYADASGQIYYVLIYSDKPIKDKYSATLAKIYRSDGLAWSNNLQLGFIPSELTFRTDTGELTVKGATMQTVIDKNGKVMK